MSTAELTPPRPFQLWGNHLMVELPGARAVFTTRRGGRSRGPYATLNLGLKTADSREAVIANRAALSSELNLRLTYVRQVHGRRVGVGAIPDDPAGGPSGQIHAHAESVVEHGPLERHRTVVVVVE